MEIVLMCPGAESGQSAFLPEMIEGIPAPERRYNILNGKITLAGQPDAVLHHDADELLKQSIFRMPTLQEQEQMFQEAQQASMAQESAPADTAEQGVVLDGSEQAPDGSDNGEQTPPDSQPPAVDNKQKKASGG